MNYYEILEVEEDADSESIKKAYKRLAKKFHPDLNPEDIKYSEEQFKKINEAYHVLIDRKNVRNTINLVLNISHVKPLNGKQLMSGQVLGIT